MFFSPPTIENAVMILEPAHSASDFPREPQCEAGRRREREQWLRRRLLQRQLHDGAALRISALTLRLGLLRHRSPTGGQAVQDCIGELQDDLHAVLEELRDVAARIYPPLLDEAGLGPALREITDQLQASVTVVASGERFGPAAEGAAYFAVADCLAALSRPPGTRAVEIMIRRDGNDLVLSVAGIDPCHAGLLHDRALPLGGSVTTVEGMAVDRSATSSITARFPCE